MGCVKGVSYDQFPEQGIFAGKLVEVCFNYDTKRTIPGRIVRDDAVRPFVTIIQLDDGRFVLATECQWTLRHTDSVTDDVLARVQRMFGERTELWLMEPNASLGGRRPLSVLHEDPEKVNAVLTRLEHGVFE